MPKVSKMRITIPSMYSVSQVNIRLRRQVGMLSFIPRPWKRSCFGLNYMVLLSQLEKLIDIMHLLTNVETLS